MRAGFDTHLDKLRNQSDSADDGYPCRDETKVPGVARRKPFREREKNGKADETQDRGRDTR